MAGRLSAGGGMADGVDPSILLIAALSLLSGAALALLSALLLQRKVWSGSEVRLTYTSSAKGLQTVSRIFYVWC